MQFVGIDPGTKGAITILDPTKSEIVSYNLPIMTERRATTSKKILDAVKFFRILQALEHDAVITVEDVFSRPTDGHVGVFSFGMNKGAIVSLIYAAGFEPRYVAPSTWKQKIGVSSDKTKTKNFARAIFKDALEEVSNEGKCESALIALFSLLTASEGSRLLGDQKTSFRSPRSKLGV